MDFHKLSGKRRGRELMVRELKDFAFGTGAGLLIAALLTNHKSLLIVSIIATVLSLFIEYSSKDAKLGSDE